MLKNCSWLRFSYIMSNILSVQHQCIVPVTQFLPFLHLFSPLPTLWQTFILALFSSVLCLEEDARQRFSVMISFLPSVTSQGLGAFTCSKSSNSLLWINTKAPCNLTQGLQPAVSHYSEHPYSADFKHFLQELFPLLVLVWRQCLAMLRASCTQELFRADLGGHW